MSLVPQKNAITAAAKRRPRRPGVVRVGTASWSDPGFVKDWYPAKLAPKARLAWYAKHFQLVEVNSSFYAVPDPAAVARWCEETPRDFVFDVKLHQYLSRHSTSIKFLPPELRSLARVERDKAEWHPDLEAALVKRILRSVEPLEDAGKMGSFLLQMSPAFRPRTHALTDLDLLLDLLAGHRLAVELRNRDWLIGATVATTRDYFEQHRVTLVAVDAPQSDHFTVMPSVDLVTNPDFAYLRAHGRNARGYVRGRTVADRFDYEYSEDELAELARRSEHLANLAAEIHVVFNNNKSNYAPRAAERFQEIVRS